MIKGGRYGVLLVNLGSPETPTPAGVRAFLRAFLSDPRVVELPRLFWLPLLHGIILPLRSRRVAHAYQSIWWEEGSPLRVITRRQVAGVAERLQRELGDRAPRVEFAMTYGQPSIADAIHTLLQSGAERIIVLPLYPQFSATTTGPVYDQVTALQQASRNIPDITVIKDYYRESAYLDALAASVRSHWSRHGGPTERLLVSFHGLPQSCIDRGDPYYGHCAFTAQALAARLDLPDSAWCMAFQSRFGRAEWIKPYITDVIETWARDGVSSVTVVCPAFAADCLETLEEMDEQVREQFLAAGGKRFERVACLNDDASHLDCLAGIVLRMCQHVT